MTTAGLEKLRDNVGGRGSRHLRNLHRVYGSEIQRDRSDDDVTSVFAEAIRMAFYQYVLRNLNFDLVRGCRPRTASLLFLCRDCDCGIELHGKRWGRNNNGGTGFFLAAAL